MKNGRIPERMVAYLKPETSSLGDGEGSQWWSFPPDKRETPGFAKYTSRAAFVVPSDSDAFKKSASEWASDKRYGKNSPFDTHGFENKPFSNLRWVGIDSRMNGGTAYKVVTPQGWLVDLREDVVMECLYEGKIRQLKNQPQGVGTYFTAEFVWVVMGSQVRIVRVGSKIHSEIVESVDRNAKAKLEDADLELGGVYLNKRGEKIVLLGKGSLKGRKYLVLHYSSYGSEKQTSARIQGDVNGGIDIIDRGRKDCSPSWNLMGSLAVVEKVGGISVPDDLYEKYVKHLQKFTGVKLE